MVELKVFEEKTKREAMLMGEEFLKVLHCLRD
jgi:hypothetical protein